MTCCPTCGSHVENKLLIDWRNCGVSYGDKSVRLSPQQVSILGLLSEKYPAPTSKDYIIERVNGRRSDQGFCDITLKVQVCNLRKKLAGFPLKIVTMWGTGGYQLVILKGGDRSGFKKEGAQEGRQPRLLESAGAA